MSKINVPFVRNPYNYNTDEASNASAVDFKVVDETTGELVDELSLTVQSHKDEADINTIVRRFGIGNQPVMPLPEHFGEFSGIFDFQTAMNQVRSAQETFNALPAEIRSEFHNDPNELIQKLGQESFRARALELGLIVAPPPIPAELDVDRPKDDAKQKDA